MKVGRHSPMTNVPRPQSESSRVSDTDNDPRGDNILRMLDLSKYEQPRPEEFNASMRANVAAIVFLALLVFFAKEDFRRLERSNLCATTLGCVN
jgi:hypothetical protein